MSGVIHRPRKPAMTRRRFLRDIGVSAGATAFVCGLDSLFAKAQVPAVPKKRFIFMYTPDGTLYSAWRVPQAGTNIDLTSGVLNSSACSLQPLAQHASKLLVLDRLSLIGARAMYQDLVELPPGAKTVDGLDHPGAGQKGMANLLTGQVLIGGQQNFSSAGLADGISIDQVIANNLFNGLVKFPSLQIAVVGTNDLYAYNDREDLKVLSYPAPARPLVPVSDPFVLFNTLFGNAMPTTPATALRQLMDKSVLDGVIADFNRLQPRVSSADWQILQQHQSSVRDIEMKLTATVSAACKGTPPPAPAGVDVTNAMQTAAWTELPGSYPIAGPMLMDVMVQALACGLTNVVTFQWAHSGDNLTYDFLNLGPNAGLPASQCGLSGGGNFQMAQGRDPNLVYVEQFYAGQLANLLGQLDVIPDSGTSGTLLDNSLVMSASDTSDVTSCDNVAITLAGSNGGYFKQGKLLRFNDVFTPLDTVAMGYAPSNPTYFLTNAWYVGAVQAAAGDQDTIGTPDLSNNDLFASILDSFGLDIHTVMPSAADPRFFHGLLPGVKAGS